MFAVCLVTIISLTYFICISGSNTGILRDKILSYVIVSLPIKFSSWLLSFKEWYIFLTPNPHSFHTPSTLGFLGLSGNFFKLGQFYSFHHKVLFHFAAGSSFSLVTVYMSLSVYLSAPYSMGVNPPNQQPYFIRLST